MFRRSPRRPALRRATVDESDIAQNAATQTVNFAGAFTSHYGADGPGPQVPASLIYDLDIPGQSNGVATGLVETSTGHEVFLVRQDADTVIGVSGTNVN